MKNRAEIILSGVGGQGLVLAGTILGKAATAYEEKFATLTTSNTVATRGAFSKADLIVSAEEIHYPEVVRADVVLCLAQVAYNKYKSDPIAENGIIIYDDSLVHDVENTNAFGFPISVTAREKGNIASANILALGIIMSTLDFISNDAVIKVLETTFGSKQQVLELNLEMYRTGLLMGDAIRK